MVIDLMTGQRFGRFVVLGPADKRYFYKVLCDCGVTKDVNGYSLRAGDSKSCGCLSRETAAANRRLEHKAGKTPALKHGHNRAGNSSPTYNSWLSAKKRCLNPNSNRYYKYGGANPPVTICARWLSFENFLQDMGERPGGTTLGRFGDVGNYEPGNASWQTPAEHVANRRPDRNCGACKNKSVEQIAA